jgi:hypothetical protein
MNYGLEFTNEGGGCQGIEKIGLRMCYLTEKIITCFPGQVPFSAIQLFTALNNHSSLIIGGNMSEKSAPRPTLPGRLLILLCIFLSVLILILGYSAGWIGLPYYVLTNYQNKNCDTTLSLNKVYLALYPRFMQDKTISAPIEECKQYLSALKTEQEGHWQEAYDAYRAYAASFPRYCWQTGEEG